MTLPLGKRTAVFVALFGLWLFACLGVFIVLTVGDWIFIPSDSRSLMHAQIGGFYFAIFGAQLPAVSFVALVFSQSKFRHPVLAAALTTLIYQMMMFAIQFARQSGAFSFHTDRWVAVQFYFVGTISLVLIVMFITWIIGKGNKAQAPNLPS